MKVETFETVEVKEETEQQSAEAITLINELGLKGQLVKTDTETKTRSPYRLMKDDEKFVYSLICPEQSDVHEFSNEPIPLEVLKTLAFAKSLGIFHKFQVWSASSKSVKDPILLGYPGEVWNGKAHLLARWGEELLPLEVLLPTALNIWNLRRKQALHEIIQKCKQALELPPIETIPSSSSMPYVGGISD